MRCDVFGGQADAWEDWAFAFKRGIRSMSPEVYKAMLAAKSVPDDLNDNTENHQEGGDDEGGVDPAGSAAKNFNTAAARVIMKVMYAARMARPDLSRSIAYVAKYLTNWTEEQDKRPHHLMAYINNSLGTGCSPGTARVRRETRCC